MNNTQLIGRLTKDPEMKYTQSGVAMANFTLAVNRPFKNAEGKNEADFILIQAWRKTAENVANFLKKGSQVAITGRIQTRNYENDAGQRVYVTEVVADFVQFLDAKQDSGQGQQQSNNNQQGSQNQNQNQNQNNNQQGSQYQNQNNNQSNQQGNGQPQQQQQGAYPNGQQNQQQQGGYNNGGQNNYQNNTDPFANGGNGNNGGMTVSDDDLPF